LLDAKIAQIHSNFYGDVFKRSPQVLYFDVGGGGGTDYTRSVVEQMFASDYVARGRESAPAMEGVLLSDWGMRAVDKLIVETVLLNVIASTLKTSGGIEISALDGLLLIDSVAKEMNRALYDALLLGDSSVADVFAGVIERLLTDSVMLTDNAVRDLLKTAHDDLLITDWRAMEIMRSLIDALALGETQDARIVKGELEQLLSDGLVLDDRIVFDHWLGVSESVFLADVRFSELLMQLRETAIMLNDISSLGYDVTQVNAVLLSDVLVRMNELLNSDAMMLADSALREWFGVVLEFLVYARLAAVEYLGATVSHTNYPGINISNNRWRVEA
jgi:hypothetical protein